jgi:nitroreductase
MNDSNVSDYAGQSTYLHLPPPRTTGGRPLREALAFRRSDREFSVQPLPLQMLSELLWSACGINRPSSHGRTAPSARNWQEIEVYAVLPVGAFLYEPDGNRLRRVSAEDLRAATGAQDFVATAPLNLVYVADLERVGAIEPFERRFYCAADAAFVAENVYLYCASEGLATVARGLVDRRALAKVLALRKQQRVMLAQTVGLPLHAT